MAFQQKDNSGSLFKNDRKELDSHPNAKGTAMIDGVEYWVSAWTKDGSKGKYQSLSFKRKEAAQAPKPERTYADEKVKPLTSRDVDFDEVPF